MTTTYAIILACIAFMLVIGAVRGNPGRAVADTALLVILFGMITIIDIVFSQFIDTGGTAMFVAAATATVFAVDALYGMMAPDRQRQRNRMLRDLMRRRA